MKKTSIAIACLSFAGLAAPALAASIVDTPLPDPVSSGGQQTVGNSSNIEKALRFSVAQQTVITSVAGFFQAYQPPYAITVKLYSDATDPYNQTIPGLSLYSASFGIADNGSGPSWQGIAGLNWGIVAGDYWVGFSSAGFAGIGGSDEAAAAHDDASQSIYGGWSHNDALDLAVRVEGTAQSASPAVPEPASWAMMLAGFGLVGFAVRRERPLCARLRRSHFQMADWMVPATGVEPVTP